MLVVEDDAAIRNAVHRGLTDRGHAVASTTSGVGALEVVLREPPDLVLLDLGLPDIDGITLISMIRAASSVPIIVITANDDTQTLVRALDAGADDYVVKPFGTDQVAARMRAVLRRVGHTEAPGPLRVGDLVINERTRIATLAGEPLQLSRKEFDVLLALAARAGEVVTKRELLAEVWRDAYGSSERTLDVHLSWLRRKLGETAAEPRYLVSVRGVGHPARRPDGPARSDRSPQDGPGPIPAADAPQDLMAGPRHHVGGRRGLRHPAVPAGAHPRPRPGHGGSRPGGAQRRDPGGQPARRRPARRAGHGDGCPGQPAAPAS